MGGSLSSALRKLTGRRECRLLMNGLDAAGKTTILYKLKLGEVVTTIPTIGFNVEQVEFKNVSITAWDLGGRDKIRPLWRHYAAGAEALVYVVDSADRERMDQARDELASMIDLMDDLKAVLVFANKQDLPSALSVNEVRERLELPGAVACNVVASCAASGDGLYDGLDWLSHTLRSSLSSSSSPSPSGAPAKSWLGRVIEWVV